MSETKKNPHQEKGGGEKNKQHSGASYKERSKQSPVNGVSMLKLGDRGSLTRVKEELTDYLQTQFPYEGTFMSTEKYYVVPMPDLTEINDTTTMTATVKNKMIEQAMGKYFEQKRGQDAERRKMFGLLKQVMDVDGKDSLHMLPDFKDLNEKGNDPLKLWELICQIYNSGHGMISKITEDVKQDALIYYNRLHQGDKTLLELKTLLIAAKSNMVTLKVEYVPTEKQLAMDFLSKLDKRRYEAYTTNLRNNVACELLKYPDNIEDAYRQVTLFRTGKPSNYTKDTKKFSKDTAFKATTTKDVSKIECYNCHKKGHYATDCPEEKKTKKDNYSYVTTVLKTGQESNLKKNWLVLDTAATAHCIDEDMSKYLTEVSKIEDEHTINGIGGKIVVKKSGLIPGFGSGLIVKNLGVNIISFTQLELNNVQINYVSKEYFKITFNNDYYCVFNFDAERGLYICKSWKPFNKSSDNVLVASVQENKSFFSKHEVTRLELVRNLIKNLSYCSIHEVKQLINSGAIMQCPVTSKDVDNYVSVYGGDAAYIKGTMVDKGPQPRLQMEKTSQNIGSRDVCMYVDFGFFDGTTFLVVVLKPINLIITIHMVDRKTTTIIDQLESVVNEMSLRGFKTVEIRTDDESCFKKIAYVADIPVNSDPNKEAVVERAIRLVKERVRSKLASLPYLCCTRLIIEAVNAATTAINLIPRSSGVGVSAREAFTGVKADYRNIKYGFGDYVQVYNKNIKRKNAIYEERSYGGVLVRPTFSDYGSWKIFNPVTGKTVISNNFKLLPMPDEMVEHLNGMRAKEESTGMTNDDESCLYDDFDIDVDVQCSPDESVVEEIPVVDGVADDSGEVIAPAIITSNNDTMPELIEYDGDSDIDDDDDEIDDNSYTAPENDEQPETMEWNDIVMLQQMTVKHAMRVDPEFTDAAVRKEINQLIDKDVFVPIDMEANKSNISRRRIIPCITRIREKENPDGTIKNYKGRICAGGHMMDKKLYGDTSCSTLKPQSLMIMFAEAAAERKVIRSMDIEGAYLECKMPYMKDNGEVDADSTEEKIYMNIPKELVKYVTTRMPKYKDCVLKDGSMVVLLTKALYGCVISGKLWYDKLCQVLIGCGYTISTMDPCEFMKNIKNEWCKIGFFGDDLLVMHTNDSVVLAEIDEIGKHFAGYTVSNKSDFKHLGIYVSRRDNDDVCLSMENYTKEIITENNVLKTVVNPNYKDYFELDESELLDKTMQKKYHTIVAKLLFMAKRTRPDILMNVSYLSSFVNKPTDKKWKCLWKLLEYLNGTANRGVVFKGGASSDITLYCDAAYMCHTDLRSRGGWGIWMAGALVFAKSSMLSIVCQSSTEAELVTSALAGDDANYINEIKAGMKLPVNKYDLMEDNQSVIEMLKNGKPTSQRTRHISMRHFKVAEWMKEDKLSVVWCPTDKMIADIWTKPLLGKTFTKFRDMITEVVTH